MLADLKLLLGIQDASQDTLLQLLINRCTEEAENYTNNNVNNLRNCILAMCCYQYNLMQTQKNANEHAGVTQETYSSVSFTYGGMDSILSGDSISYPKSIIDSLKAKRKVGVI